MRLMIDSFPPPALDPWRDCFSSSVLLVVAAAAFLLAACGGDDDDPPDLPRGRETIVAQFSIGGGIDRPCCDPFEVATSTAAQPTRGVRSRSQADDPPADPDPLPVSDWRRPRTAATRPARP